MQTLKLDCLMESLNEHDNASRSSKFAGADLKKQWTEYVWGQAKVQHLKPMKGPNWICFIWHTTKKEKHDPDNICFAKKYILDGLVLAKVLKNDTLKDITGFTDDFIKNSQIGYVEVVIHGN